MPPNCVIDTSFPHNYVQCKTWASILKYKIKIDKITDYVVKKICKRRDHLIPDFNLQELKQKKIILYFDSLKLLNKRKTTFKIKAY